MDRLRRLKVPGASLSTVEGFGHEAGPGGERTYTERVSPYVTKLKLEVVCQDDRIDETAEAIAAHAQTGRRGDGKVFILPVEQAIDIRTPRTGPEAL
jgi:nitrogen regulatory protein P-II 1